MATKTNDKKATEAQTKKYMEWVNNGSPSPRPEIFDNTRFDGTTLWHIGEPSGKGEPAKNEPVVNPIESNEKSDKK